MKTKRKPVATKERFTVSTWGNHFGIEEELTPGASRTVLRTINNGPEQLEYARRVARLLNVEAVK